MTMTDTDRGAANSAETSRPRPRPGPAQIVDAIPGADAVRNVDLTKLSPSGLAKRATSAPVPRVKPGDVAGFSGLARFGASSLWRALGWAAKGTVESGRGLVKEVSSGEPILDIVDHRVEAARSAAQRALGIGEVREDSDLTELSGRHTSYRNLRAAGDHLLRLSLDTESQPRDEHPAFARILEELAPDEARILRFMALSGPQPAIDVRTKTPFMVGSERIAGGINMIADMAGCTYPDRNQQYLANLNRLGMIRFSEEQVEDPRRYSFLEAQPVTMDAMARTKKARTVYRSIYLSLFGRQFCEVCFTLDDGYDAGGWIHDVR